MHIVDDFSSFIWSIPLCDKSCAWQRLCEAELSLKVGTYHTDHGKLWSNQMEAWLSSCAMKQEFTVPYTSAQNGHSERAHLTIMNLVRTMRLSCGLPKNRWDEFTKTAAYLLVRAPTSTLHNRTPFEAFYGHKPDLSHREIGARAFVLHNVPHNSKIGPRSFECILIGYAGNSKAYCCYHCATHKVIESLHVHFIESKDELPCPLLPGVVILLPSPNNIPDIHHSPLPPCASPPPLHCSSRIHGVATDPVALQLDCADPSAHDPLSFGEARRSVD